MFYFIFLSCSAPKDTTNGLTLEPSSESDDNIVQPESDATDNNSTDDSGNLNEENQLITIAPHFIQTKVQYPSTT